MAGLNDGAAPSLACLNYVADADTEEPRIAALPVTLPILVGVPIPSIRGRSTTKTQNCLLPSLSRKSGARACPITSNKMMGGW